MVRPWMLSVSFVLPCSAKEYVTRPVLDPLMEHVAKLYNGEVLDVEEAWFTRTQSEPLGPEHAGHERVQCSECRGAYSVAGRRMDFTFWTPSAANSAAAALGLMQPVVSTEVRFVPEEEEEGFEERARTPAPPKKEYLN